MTDKRTPSSQMRKTKMAGAIQMSNRRNTQIIITNKPGTQREQTKAQQSPLLMMFCQRFSMRALSYRPAQYTMASLHSHRSKRSANSSYNWIIQATVPVNCTVLAKQERTMLHSLNNTIIITNSFMGYFSRLEHIAHYNAKNQKMVTTNFHEHTHMHTHAHTHSRIAWRGEILEMILKTQVCLMI